MKRVLEGLGAVSWLVLGAILAALAGAGVAVLGWAGGEGGWSLLGVAAVLVVLRAIDEWGARP